MSEEDAITVSTIHQYPYEKVVSWLQEQTRQKEQDYTSKPINDKTKSQFLKAATRAFNGFMFGTIYTGGTIKSKHIDWHRIFLNLYIEDVKKGLYLAWTEKCGEAHVRLYFEFDYRSTIRLPSMEEQKEHVLMAYQLATESYPECDAICYIAHCLPKLKKKSSQWQHPKLAAGLHLVFPYIYSNAQEIRTLMLTLDARITKKNPFFKDVVDPESCHTHSCSLRPLYALRAEKCKGCNPVNKTKEKKKSCNQEWNEAAVAGVECESDEDESPPPCGRNCNEGYQFIVSSSFYEPWYILHSTDGKDIKEECNTHDDIEMWIHNMSIIRNPQDNNGPNAESQFIIPVDAVSYDSIRVRSYHPMFPGEKAKGHYLSHETNIEQYKLMTDLLHWYSPKWNSAFAAKVDWSPKLSLIYINVMGPKDVITNCLMNDGCHSNNRVYFVVKIKYEYWIQIQCHKKECKKNYKLIYATKPQPPLDMVQLSILNQGKKPLSEEWIQRLQAAFGLDGQFLSFKLPQKAPLLQGCDEKLVFDPRVGMKVKPERLTKPVLGLIEPKETVEIKPVPSTAKKRKQTVLSNNDIFSQLDHLF